MKKALLSISIMSIFVFLVFSCGKEIDPKPINRQIIVYDSIIVYDTIFVIDTISIIDSIIIIDTILPLLNLDTIKPTEYFPASLVLIGFTIII